MSEAVTGPLTGKKLTKLPSTLTTWKKWRRLQPRTLVLSTDTGYQRDYSQNPYARYFKSKSPFSLFSGKSPGLSPKELVIGIEIAGTSRAYPLRDLKKLKAPVEDVLGGMTITIHPNKEGEPYLTDASGELLPSTTSYWYVWYSFHSESEIYQYK